MATQGVVSVVSEGQVVLKVVAGCNGYNAKRLGTWLRRNWPVNPQNAYQAAQDLSFGSDVCLVVMSRRKTLFHGDEPLHRRYRRTFNNPQFNPRWSLGTAAHVVVIDVSDRRDLQQS